MATSSRTAGVPALLLPFAVGLASTALGIAGVPGWWILDILASYAVGRELFDERAGPSLAALYAPHLLAVLVARPGDAGWALALVPIGLVLTALPLSIGQLHGRREVMGRSGEDALKRRIGQLVAGVALVGAVTLVGALVLLSGPT